MLSPILFGNGAIERAAHLRNDEAAQATMQAAPEARFMAMWRGHVLVTDAPEIAWLTRNEAAKASRGDPLFLGLLNGEPRYAVDIPDWAVAGSNEGQFEQTKPLPTYVGRIFDVVF